MNELIKENWYEIQLDDRWIFKFDHFEEPNRIWESKCGTPKDKYKVDSANLEKSINWITGRIEDCKFANMNEVFNLFPEEKDLLLEEAKRRYPVGTKFKCPAGVGVTGIHEVEEGDEIEFYEYSCDNIDIIGKGYLYYSKEWAEIVEEPKVETKFEIGKWYHSTEWDNKNDYIKLSKVELPRKFYFIEKIYNGEHKVLDTYWNCNVGSIREVPLSEIQQYLPDGHPDKIKQEVKEEVKPNITWKIGDYVVFTEDWSCSKKGDIDKIKKLGAGVIALYLENEELVGSPLHKECKLKVFPTLQEAQKFSDELLGKSKTSLSVEDLVEGEIYYCENINNSEWSGLFLCNKMGDNHFVHRLYVSDSYKDNRFNKNSKWILGDKKYLTWSIANDLQKKWLKTCIKQDKFIPKEDLNKYDDDGNLMESKKYPEYVEFGGVIYKVKDWTPHSYCKLIRHANDSYPTPLEPFKHLVTPSTKEAYETQFKKDEEFKVGDYVITKGYNSNYDGRVLKITRISCNIYCYFKVIDGGYFNEDSNFNKEYILRKALPHEIPVENSVKQYPYTPEESIKLDFEVKWEEPRYIGGVDSITATGWGIYEQMKKQPIQSRKTPDLIDKSKVEVKIKRTKVKQIKL